MVNRLTLLFCILLVVASQKYPHCPGGVPIDIGNASDLFFVRVLDLTDFMDYHDTGALVQAFDSYSRTASSQKIEEVVNENRLFYIIVLVILGCTTLMLFIVMLKVGDIKLGKKDIFEKIKEEGFSSPLSAFFILVAVMLLASACTTAYLLAQMMSSLQMTQCRADVLNNVYLKGADRQNWAGVVPYAEKMQLISNLFQNINDSMASQWINLSQSLTYGKDNIKQLEIQYSGIINSYEKATIQSGSTQIGLTSLIPNLFSGTTANSTALIHEFKTYLEFLEETLYLYEHLEVVIDGIYSSANFTISILQSMAFSLTSSAQSYSNDYTSLRTEVQTFFTGTHTLLIMTQILIGLTIFCTVVAIISLKLIQNNYDYFSIRSYKMIWMCLMILFCLNLFFLLIFNETIVFNKGACNFSQKIMNNRTYLQDVFPQTREGGSMYYMVNCYYDHQFDNFTHTQDFIGYAQEYTRLKEALEDTYTPVNVGFYQNVLEKVIAQLRQYQFGSKGTFAAMDSQLSLINAVSNSNYQGQACFKHQWVYSASQCTQNYAAAKPSSVGFLNHSSNYQYYPSLCYVLNDYPVNNQPSAHNHSSFSNLYYPYSGECPYSVHKLTSTTVDFFELMDSRVNTLNGLVDSISNLSVPIQSTTAYLIDYHNRRTPFLSATFQSLSSKFTSYYLSSGNSCDIIKHLIKGVYNQFCLNFQALSHEVYLLVVCNICYTILLIIFSLLYALELRNMSKKDVMESYHNMQFMQTNQRIASSESQSELSQSIENKSTKSRESAERE